MSSLNNIRPPSGTRDFLPDEFRARERVLDTAKAVFERSGFLPMDTPAFERIETLMGKYGEEGEGLIFKILGRGRKESEGIVDLALRYDLTVPLARYVARYRGRLPKVFKRYQIGPVWRAERPAKGRFREFYQADIDIVGSPSISADAEAVITIGNVLSELDLPKIVIKLNSRKALDGLLEVCDVPTGARKDVLVSLDKLDKVGIRGVEEDLLGRGLSGKVVIRVLELIEQDLPSLRKSLGSTKVGSAGLAEVDELMELVSPALSGGRLKFSPLLARGLDYYTGPIFEVFDSGSSNAIASGGRYDGLIGELAGTAPTPATGGSLGVERLVQLLESTPLERTGARVFITVWDASFRGDAFGIASELRAAGIATDVYLGEDNKNLSAQLKTASRAGTEYCIIFGPDEKAKKEVSVKELSTGEQTKMPRTSLVGAMRALINSR